MATTAQYLDSIIAQAAEIKKRLERGETMPDGVEKDLASIDNSIDDVLEAVKDANETTVV